MNNKEEISLQLFICFIWWLMSSVECNLAGKHQLRFKICSPPLSLCIFCLMGTSIVFSTSVNGFLLVTWPACGVKQRQVVWTRDCALNLDSGVSAAIVHLLPFPACQINSPTDLVPRLHADKRHSWKAGQPGPVWRNSIIAAEKRRSRRQD